MVDYDIIHILQWHVRYTSWAAVPMKTKELCYKRYHDNFTLPDWDTNQEKYWKKQQEKLDKLEQIIQNLIYLLYESKNCPCYVWCIHLNSVWDKCYILESYIVMLNIILKTNIVISYLCYLGLTKCCLLSFRQIILSVSLAAAKKRKQRLWMSPELKEVQRKERKIKLQA